MDGVLPHYIIRAIDTKMMIENRFCLVAPKHSLNRSLRRFGRAIDRLIREPMWRIRTKNKLVSFVPAILLDTYQ
jgi:hypothetical protein